MDVGIEGDGLMKLRLIGRIIHAHGFALGHVALVGHPADDLAPETIVIFVFNTFAPTPGAVGAHEENFAYAIGARDEEREATEFVGDVFMDAEDFGAGFGANDRGIPLEAGKIFPDFGVFVL